MLAGVELLSLRQRALGLLRSRMLEQCANLMVGPSILGCRRLWKPPKQCYHSSDVLAFAGEVRERLIILDDPLVHVTGHGACMPPISMVVDLAIELRAFLLKL